MAIRLAGRVWVWRYVGFTFILFLFPLIRFFLRPTCECGLVWVKLRYVLTRLLSLLFLLAGFDTYLGTGWLSRIVSVLFILLVRGICLAVDEYVDLVRRGWECPPSEVRKRLGECSSESFGLSGALEISGEGR